MSREEDERGARALRMRAQANFQAARRLMAQTDRDFTMPAASRLYYALLEGMNAEFASRGLTIPLDPRPGRRYSGHADTKTRAHEISADSRETTDLRDLFQTLKDRRVWADYGRTTLPMPLPRSLFDRTEAYLRSWGVEP